MLSDLIYAQVDGFGGPLRRQSVRRKWGIETVDTIISVCGPIQHVLIGESPRTGGQQMEIIYQKDKGWKFAVAPRTFLAFASVIIAYYAPEHLPKVISILRAALAAS